MRSISPKLKCLQSVVSEFELKRNNLVQLTTSSSGGSRISETGGGGGERQPIIWQNFTENYRKMKKNVDPPLSSVPKSRLPHNFFASR